MPQVVETLNEGGLIFEIYDDGDCVLTNAPGGYVQLSAVLISRLAKVARIGSIRRKLTEPEAQTSTLVIGMDPGHALAKACAFSIRKLVDTPGWQCSLFDEQQQIVLHVYESRSLARSGLLSNPIGTAGRIA